MQVGLIQSIEDLKRKDWERRNSASRLPLGSTLQYQFLPEFPAFQTASANFRLNFHNCMSQFSLSLSLSNCSLALENTNTLPDFVFFFSLKNNARYNHDWCIFTNKACGIAGIPPSQFMELLFYSWFWTGWRDSWWWFRPRGPVPLVLVKPLCQGPPFTWASAPRY